MTETGSEWHGVKSEARVRSRQQRQRDPTVLLLTHPACLEHDTGEGHPEHAGRLRAVLEALDAEAFRMLDRAEAPEATLEQLYRVHPAFHVQRVLEAIPLQGRAALDVDTIVSRESRASALRAAGAVAHGVDTVFGGATRRVFCAVRPPGHHAESSRAMGFCLFNSIAIGAAHALAAGYAKRVAIVDFDVHHGNGTQEIFWAESRILYVSTHQSPLYPGTGSASETGTGNIVNVLLPPGAGSLEFRRAWNGILDRIDHFEPGLILVSAGFDAHRLDPLADLNVETEDYGWITQHLVRIADTHCEGRMVSALEGGYSPTALRESVTAHVLALMDEGRGR